MARPLLICRVQARGGMSKTSTPCSSRCRGSTRVICQRPNASPCLKKWKIAAKILPYMAILARKLPATSAPAERLFSSAGNTQTKKRNRLICDNLEKLVYLNWPLVREWNMKAILKD